MKKRIVVVVLGLLALLIITPVYILGSRMPREHRSVVTVTLPASRPVVWNAITDYPAIPAWWPAIESVRIENRIDGTELTWNTDSHRRREIPYRTGESHAFEKLVRIIARDDLAYGGSWTYELSDAANGGTLLTLTEDGIIRSPIYRAKAAWFTGYDDNQKDFLAHLEKHLAAKK